MRVSCSVVSGSDQQAIIVFLRSFAASASHARKMNPSLTISVVAIVNGADRGLESQVAPLCDTVVFRPRPLGFAANHNEVMRELASDFHIIANDDVIVQEDTISSLLEIMQQPANNNVAVLSPLLRNTDGSLQASTYSFPTIPAVLLAWTGLRQRLPARLLRLAARIVGRGAGGSRFWDHNRQIDVETLRGAFVLTRMAAVTTIGPMTEIALVGGEETEWHARMNERGWRVVFTPATAVTHVGRVTTGARPDLEVEYLKGTVNYFAQHRSLWSFRIVRFAALRKLGQIGRRYRRTTGVNLPLHGRRLDNIEYRPS